jgi:site-specific DNA-adenine methylase
MSDAFSLYKKKRVYKSMATSDNFISPDTNENILKFWDSVFLQVDEFDEALKLLKSEVTPSALKTLKRRYSKYKSANKCRSENFGLHISQETGAKLIEVKEELGLNSYEEVLDYLLYEQYKWTPNGKIIR